jgi:hypothetical protein
VSDAAVIEEFHQLLLRARACARCPTGTIGRIGRVGGGRHIVVSECRPEEPQRLIEALNRARQPLGLRVFLIRCRLGPLKQRTRRHRLRRPPCGRRAIKQLRATRPPLLETAMTKRGVGVLPKPMLTSGWRPR